MEIFLHVGLLLFSFFLIIWSADLLVENGEKLGYALNVPVFLIGVLVMAIGTSLPELATGISATLKNETDLVVANVLGSNVANVFLGLGLVSLIARKSIPFKQDVFEVHFPILMMSVFAVITTLYDGVITQGEGVIFASILCAYMWFLFSKDQRKLKTSEKKSVAFHWKYPLFILLGFAGLAFSADLLIDSIITIAETFGIAKSALAGSLVAVGTSIPEIALGISAVRKENTELLIGNILGSNIFNVVLILSVSSFIAPLTISEQTQSVLLPFFVGSTIIYWVSKKDKKITVQEGSAMTILYVLFLGKLFGFL